MNPPSNISLAQQALAIHDVADEQAMLDFIADQMDTAPKEALESQHSLIVLRDHTCIQAKEGLYAFLWLDYEEFQGSTIKTDRIRTRLATVPESQRPRPKPRDTAPRNFQAKLIHEMNNVLAANGNPVKLSPPPEEQQPSLIEETRRVNIAARHAVEDWTIRALCVQGLKTPADFPRMSEDWVKKRDTAFHLSIQTKQDMPKLAEDAIHQAHTISRNLCCIDLNESPQDSQERIQEVSTHIAMAGQTLHRTLKHAGRENNLLHQFQELLDKLE